MGTLISPLLWQSVPFRPPKQGVSGLDFVPYGILNGADADNDPFQDFLGQHQGWHRELARVTKTAFVLTDDLQDNLAVHATMHKDIAKALGVAPVNDLESFDLRDETSWVSWHFLHAADHARFQLASGL